MNDIERGRRCCEIMAAIHTVYPLADPKTSATYARQWLEVGPPDYWDGTLRSGRVGLFGLIVRVNYAKAFKRYTG